MEMSIPEWPTVDINGPYRCTLPIGLETVSRSLLSVTRRQTGLVQQSALSVDGPL